MKTLLWSNATWAIWQVIRNCQCSHICQIQRPYMMLEKKTTGQCDYPIRYDDGKVAYDCPEIIPPYIRKQIELQFKKILNKKG